MENDAVYHDGFLLVRNGLIAQLGDMKDCPEVMDGEEVLDLSGKTIFPGFIDAHCHIGILENGLGFEGDDVNEETDASTPQLRALDAVNPMDYCLKEAAAAGVTTVVTGPGSANPIGGQWCALKTAGKRIDDMLLKAPVSMKFAFGENPKSVYHGKNQAPMTRMATAAMIREQLIKTQKYAEEKHRAEEDDGYDAPEYDMKCEALIPVLQRTLKAHMHCHRADDIFTAIRIAKEFGLDYELVHCTEGHLISDCLGADGASAIIGPIICDRSKPELVNQTLKNAAQLYADGVPFAICTDHPVIPIQYLPLSAGLCVREGLPYREALKAITIHAARAASIDGRVGSLAVGKDADVVIFEGDPLSVYAKPVLVLIDGKRVEL